MEQYKDGLKFWDDVHGGWLDPAKVQEARKTELEWIHKQGVYEQRTIQERKEVTGLPPIRLLWIDINKGDNDHPNYRGRLVVREKRGKGESGRALPAALLFSAVAPLEAIRMLGSRMVQWQTSARGRPLGMRFFDISRAHFYGTAQRQIYVDLPEEEQDGIHCAILLKSMYGTQDASAIFQGDYAQVLQSAGYEGRKIKPSVVLQGGGRPQGISTWRRLLRDGRPGEPRCIGESSAKQI